MSSNFRQALELLREKSITTTDLGTAFEKMVKVFLEQDTTQTQQYEKVWHYSDWAAEQKGFSRKDIGIDLVAKIRDRDTFCAIQCKCYQAENQITKEDLDSFVSASASKHFSRLLLIDTSSLGIAPNAQQVLENLEKEYLRIQSTELENCRIDWLTLIKKGEIRFRAKHGPRPHQQQALEKALEGFTEHDRGKIIMACGTGKTYTSLIIAEKVAGAGKSVLYMVPSLSLMSQTIREWKNDAAEDFTAFSACSDKTVGSRKKDDEVIISTHDLAFPATTSPKELAEEVKKAPKDRMTVVFSTYHSIDVISDAQYAHKLGEFDLIICDEAHRTTGETLVGEDESTFVKIHSNDNVKAKKRLYMTATPRIYGEKAKSKADNENVALASMNDEEMYGPLFFHRGFGWAVENNLLTDYKVVVLAVDEGIVSEKIQNRLAEGAELKLDDATKIIGCFKALAKEGFKESDALDFASLKPMKRALAFCQSIKLSKLLENEFIHVVNEYRSKEDKTDKNPNFQVEVKHVDGSFDADLRNERLNWLKDDSSNNACRVLTNVRCLSEGVDVPALDAVIFMHPRKSQIDVVQSVGRVMRKSENKDLGYVIIPITVAPGVSPEKALNDNDKYKVVWQILNALRSHDERFDSTINKLGLGEDVSNRIEIVGIGAREELKATTAIVDDIKPKKKYNEVENGTENSGVGEKHINPYEGKGEQMAFVLADLSKAIKAKIVDRCGTRDYWENWARDIAKIAQAHITRINSIVFNSGTAERKLFEEFVAEIRDDLNTSITEDQAVEMLAQHLVTKPVFETLFKDHKFTEENPVSKSMQTILIALTAHNLENENESLKKFYDSVKRRAVDIETSTGRQTLILELYERFFSYAFKSMTERLGIVYTPVEVVDFIIRSIEDVLREEFGSSVSNKNVNILDPFTGTGTFITRLLQSKLIKPEDLKRKYDSEINANEIVLLAYYIASINAESVYQDLTDDHKYRSFNGIVLTDTFQLYEEGKDMIANLLPDNSKRRKTQRNRNINVIIGNPPYSSSAKSDNDNAKNVNYSNLDQRIRETYAINSTNQQGKSKLYDSYIRAFRMASDRIGEEGVIGFVTGAGWIDSNSTDGMRKCFLDEFDKIYVFNLRGNARSSGEIRRKESGNVFGEGSRSPIAVTILVKKKVNATRKGVIHYCEIGDYYDRDEKLALIKHYGSISGITKENKWETLKPDDKNDWIKKGKSGYEEFIPLFDKAKNSKWNNIFNFTTYGVKTNRDAWVINDSKTSLIKNCSAMMNFYNQEVERYLASDKKKSVDDFISLDPKKISWGVNLRAGVKKGKKLSLSKGKIFTISYRPFKKSYLYCDSNYVHSLYSTLKLFPKSSTKNRVIITTGIGGSSRFSSLMTDCISEHHFLGNGQCYGISVLTDEESPDTGNLFYIESNNSISNISSSCLKTINEKFNLKFTDEDLFYYIYAMLHHEEYRNVYENDLIKEGARIPFSNNEADIKAMINAGRSLGDLHISYEEAKCYPINLKTSESAKSREEANYYRVESMKFAGTRGSYDKTTVIYNNNITMSGIPIEAYEYVVNGKPALEWVMERQSVKIDKDSGIINDANDYAIETMNNPAYPLELFQRVITVSLETMKIVKSLPSLGL